MSEQLPTRNESKETEKRPLSEGAIEAALDNFATDGDAWTHGRDEFQRLTHEGHSLNEALGTALQVAETTSHGDTESTKAEAELRFWDNMDPSHEEGEDPTPAIERALDGYAKDGGTWTHAREVFYEKLKEDQWVESALQDALTAARGDSETHREVARDRFYGGVDPHYAPREHFAGRKHGVRISNGNKALEIGVGLASEEEKRKLRLRRLHLKHRMGQTAAKLRK